MCSITHDTPGIEGSATPWKSRTPSMEVQWKFKVGIQRYPENTLVSESILVLSIISGMEVRGSP